MSATPLTSREVARLKAMNRQLYPAKLRVLPSGAYQYDYRKNGKSVRQVVDYELEAAYERALLMRREMDNLPVVSKRKLTLGQWYDEWSPKSYATKSPTTVDGYRYSWKSLPDAIKAVTLEKLTNEKILEALTTIDKPAMQGHAGAFLSTVLNAAVKAGLLQSSPWKFKDRRTKKMVVALSSDDLAKVFTAATPAARIGLVLAGYCGLRRGEIMGLKAGDIDLEKKLIYIHGARIRVFGANAMEEMKSTKTGDPRVVPFPNVAMPFLSEALLGKAKEDFIYPVFRNDLHTRLKTACRAVGVPELTLHDLRHICGSNLMMTGGVALAQAVLGHRDITTTVDTYGHLSAVYLAAQVNLSHNSRDRLQRFLLIAEKMTAHPDPEVAGFAAEALQVCQ